MTKRIIDLVLEKDYITLKQMLEEKVALKLKDRIETKKKAFVEKMKADKKPCSLTESTGTFSEKLYSKLDSIGYKNHGGIIALGASYKVMVDVEDDKKKEVQITVMKGSEGKSAASIFYDTTPVAKGIDHAIAFISEVIKTVVLPDIKKDKKGK
jgi:hypothetical protein